MFKNLRLEYLKFLGKVCEWMVGGDFKRGWDFKGLLVNLFFGLVRFFC